MKIPHNSTGNVNRLIEVETTNKSELAAALFTGSTPDMVAKVLMVVYTESGEAKKIISARLAGKAERRSYHGYYQIDGKGRERDF
ncbi:MAG: BrnT family toxin [Treponema sp.]|jgi:uncharacterized DUF497 family protein|nr:BrnT family toxin [Treponema sp.]